MDIAVGLVELEEGFLELRWSVTLDIFYYQYLITFSSIISSWLFSQTSVGKRISYKSLLGSCKTQFFSLSALNEWLGRCVKIIHFFWTQTCSRIGHWLKGRSFSALLQSF